MGRVRLGPFASMMVLIGGTSIVFCLACLALGKLACALGG